MASTTSFPTTAAPTGFDAKFGGQFPWASDRCGGEFAGNTWAGNFPWNNFSGSERSAGAPWWNNSWERFGGAPWWNNFSGSERSGGSQWWNNWGGNFPWNNSWERFGGAPWSNNWGGNFPWSSNWGGNFPWNNSWERSSGAPWWNNWERSSGAPWWNNWGGNFPWSGSENSWTNDWRSMYNVGFRPSHPAEYYTLTNPVRILDREGNRQIWLAYELKGYKPEEICVTLNKAERAIIVEATHDVKEGKEHHVTRKFYRKFVLPETLAKIDLSKVELKSHFGHEGLLYVECTLPKMTTEEMAACPLFSRWGSEMPWGSWHSFGGFPCPNASTARSVNVKTA